MNFCNRGKHGRTRNGSVITPGASSVSPWPAQRRYSEAEELLIQGYEGMLDNEAKIPAASKKDLVTARDRIVPFLETSGQHQKAATWRRKLASTVMASKPAP